MYDMENLIITFILGLSVMFFGMTSWLFFRKGGRLSVIVACLMVILGAQCLMSMCFIFKDVYLDPHYWTILTSLDLCAVPFYALILRELVRPGSVTWKTGVINILPFIVFPALYIAIGWYPLYLFTVVGCAIYGISYFIFTIINIRIYNRRLKEQYSFTENINLNWLKLILIFFLVLLAVWVIDTMAIYSYLECVYLLMSMTMWMVIDYFIYKHEMEMESLNATQSEEEPSAEPPMSELGAKIIRLFTEERIYLNPNLKISDVAAAVGSNRTYVSNYFNREAATTFYDYVNALRIECASTLLLETQDSIKVIAERAGYNSPQAFIRVFSKIKGISPSEFRQQPND